MIEYFVYPIRCVLRTKGVQNIEPKGFDVFRCYVKSVRMPPPLCIYDKCMKEDGEHVLLRVENTRCALLNISF